MIRLIKSALVIFALLSVNSLMAQVTLNDLMENQNAGVSKQSNKKWILELNEAQTAELEKEVLANELVKMTKSKHWLNLAEGEITNEISFQTSKKMYVDRVIENLKEAGFVLTSSKNSDDSKTFIYTRNSVSVEVLAMSTESTAQTIYLVTLL